MSEKISKSELVRQARTLTAKKFELINRAKELQIQYQAFLVNYQPIIDRLQAQADDLANEFRRLFRESQEAYSSGEKALAKELSLGAKLFRLAAKF